VDRAVLQAQDRIKFTNLVDGSILELPETNDEDDPACEAGSFGTVWTLYERVAA
jgi:hypothetical protein